jgi:hypothetical protein
MTTTNPRAAVTIHKGMVMKRGSRLRDRECRAGRCSGKSVGIDESYDAGGRADDQFSSDGPDAGLSIVQQAMKGVRLGGQATWRWRVGAERSVFSTADSLGALWSPIRV